MVAAGHIIFPNVVSQKFYIGDLPKFQLISKTIQIEALLLGGHE